MKELNKKIQSKFAEMSKVGKLFRTELTGDKIWDLYIHSFSKEDNPIFRDPASTSKNCNHCKNFIRRYGNIVAIDENYNIVTMFDIDAEDEYKNTVKVLSEAVKGAKITEVFFETFYELNSLPYESCTKSNKKFQLGVASNPKRYTQEEAEKFGVVKPDEIRTFNHLHLFLDKDFVDVWQFCGIHNGKLQRCKKCFSKSHGNNFLGYIATGKGFNQSGLFAGWSNSLV